MPKGKLQPQPEVKLINYFEKPYENVVATARTCYSEKPVYPWDVLKTEKSAKIGKKIFRSVFEAGHHTTFQHPTFQFLISNVSREFVWSFLHSHPFYNSEQVSQRYVEVKPENFVQPIMQEKHAKIYKDTIKIQMDTYLKLTNLIKDKVEECYFEIFPSRKKDQKRWQSTIHRKALEFARYILPVATHTFLYHTISGLTLYRYWYLCQMYDVSYETQSVVSKMVKEVKKIDAKFFENIKDPIPIEQTPEFYLVCNLCKTKVTDSKFIEEFDQRLE
jgi:flavin-dependent thymidylate synthase